MASALHPNERGHQKISSFAYWPKIASCRYFTNVSFGEGPETLAQDEMVGFFSCKTGIYAIHGNTCFSTQPDPPVSRPSRLRPPTAIC